MFICVNIVDSGNHNEPSNTRPEGDDLDRDDDRADAPELESSNGKLVYLYLTTVEEETISGLKETLDMQELTLFPTLAILEDNGLIERDGETFTIVA